MQGQKKRQNNLKTIIGTFIKQEWGGHRGDDAIELGQVEFDATAAILAMPLSDIHALEDHQFSSDSIGQGIVEHSGPYEVEVEEAICDFFGVEYFDVEAPLTQITQEMLDAAKAEFATRPLTIFSVPVTRRTEATADIIVTAVDESEAKRLAKEAAPTHLFPGETTDYVAGDPSEQ